MQTRIHFQQCFVHVGSNQKFQLYLTDGILAFRTQLGDALYTFELFFLFLDDLSFDFLWTGTGPSCFDGNGWNLDFRSQLHGHGKQGNHTKEAYEQHAYEDFYRMINDGLHQSHNKAFPKTNDRKLGCQSRRESWLFGRNGRVNCWSLESLFWKHQGCDHCCWV